MAAEAQATAILVGAAVVVAAITDCWRGKIYNWLTLPLLALAPAWHFYLRGGDGLLFSLQGFGVMVLGLTVLRLLAGPGLGGGDLKLLAGVGALVGPQVALWALLFTAVSGPVVVIPVLIRKRIAGYTFRNFANNLAQRYAGGRTDVAMGEGSLGGNLPFGVCICIGTLLALFYPTPGLRW